MNFLQSFQLPRQSFPTDVTSPAPTQLPGSNNSSEVPSPQVSPEQKPPESGEQKEKEDEERAA